MNGPRKPGRFVPIALAALSQLVVIWIPSFILKRTGLPDWPWLIVLALCLAPINTGLILYSMKRLRPPA